MSPPFMSYMDPSLQLLYILSVIHLLSNVKREQHLPEQAVIVNLRTVNSIL
jgi:hypothetical protein